jgi:hypothetical protein
VNLSRLDDSTNVIIFVGASQKAVPIELVTSAQKLGTRVKWQKVEISRATLAGESTGR